MESVTEALGAATNETESREFCCGSAHRGFLSRAMFFTILAQSSYCTLPVGIIGVVGNVLIIVAYFNIGLSSSINISYVALAVSDLFCVLCNTWMAICFLPAFTRFSSRYFFVGHIVSITGAWTCECFSRITAYMTAFISVERCLSVLMPLKVSAMFTRRRTSVIIAVIYGFNLALASYGFVIIRFVKTWSPFSNRTVVSTRQISSPLLEDFYSFILIFQSFPALMIPLVTIVVCTAFLSLSLRRNAAWRRSAVSQDQSQKQDKASASKQRSLKELQLAKTVIIIAIVFIVCSSPNAINVLVASVVPQYRATGTYGVTYRLANFATFALAMVNSSSNFFIYLSVGSLFRCTIRRMLYLEFDRKNKI